jgi:hypothetical protein
MTPPALTAPAGFRSICPLCEVDSRGESANADGYAAFCGITVSIGPWPGDPGGRAAEILTSGGVKVTYVTFDTDGAHKVSSIVQGCA